MGVGLYGYAEGSAQPQVCDFEDGAGLILANQEVLWFQVSVHDSMDVAVSHPLHQLVHEALPPAACESELLMLCCSRLTLTAASCILP